MHDSFVAQVLLPGMAKKGALTVAVAPRTAVVPQDDYGGVLELWTPLEQRKTGTRTKTNILTHMYTETHT